MVIKELLNKYRNSLHISPLDLADYAETNRMHLIIASPILFSFGIIASLILLIMREWDFASCYVSLWYFGIFVVSGLYSFIHSLKSKNVSREKAYIWKNIPFYLLLYSGEAAGVYNFYCMKQPFNGFVVCYLTGCIALCLFSFSPLLFGLGIAVSIGSMTPVIRENFGITGLIDAVLAGVMMIYLAVYKRKMEINYIMMIKKQKNNLEAKTFGNFTLIYENQVVKFSRTKSNELLGYLIYKNGSSVQTKELISVLWGDSADSATYGNNLRNLIVDIKHTLNKLEIQNFFIAEYNNFRINPEAVKCDYYSFLSGDKEAINSFAGEFMSQYGWASEVSDFLGKKSLK